MARPRVPINWEIFDALCTVHATLREIAGYFRCSVDTIERACVREKRQTFAEYSELLQGAGICSLRRAQWSKAMSRGGDTRMLIHLGEQYLDQRRKSDLTTAGQAMPAGHVTQVWEIGDRRIEF